MVILQKGFGNCHKAYMVTEAPDLPQGYCQTSCGRCPTKSDTTPIKKLQSLVQKVSQQRHRSASYHNSATRLASLLKQTVISDCLKESNRLRLLTMRKILRGCACLLCGCSFKTPASRHALQSKPGSKYSNLTVITHIKPHPHHM